MSLKSRLRVIFVCVALELGVMSGMAVTPDEIRELMNQMNAPKLAHVLPSDEDGGDDGRSSLAHALEGADAGAHREPPDRQAHRRRGGE
jgi:hypothetical protein